MPPDDHKMMLEGRAMEEDALNRWLENRKHSQEPDEEFLEILAEVLRDPGILNVR